MFPLIVLLQQSKEGYILTLADKPSALKETFTKKTDFKYLALKLTDDVVRH